MPTNGTLGIVIIQPDIGNNKEKNVEHCIRLIKQSVIQHGPTFVCLPECFNSPFGEVMMRTNAEVIPGGYTSNRLSETAKQYKIHIVAGYPERNPKYPRITYNTVTVWGPDGDLYAIHRKAHLYDIELSNHRFHESDVITRGNQATVFEANGLKFGLSLGHDIYQEEFYKLYRKKGIDLMFWPANFHKTLGHQWDLLVRGRANDNQFYVVGVSSSSIENSLFRSWGNSLVSDPWGKTLVQAGKEEEILFAEIDFSKVKDYREQIPSWTNRRVQLYETIDKQAVGA